MHGDAQIAMTYFRLKTYKKGCRGYKAYKSI